MKCGKMGVPKYLGPSSAGKAHLAAGLGVKAAENGFAVVFMNADDLIEILRKDEAVDNRKLRRRRYMNASLLIIDELGFQTLDRHSAHLLFRVNSQRYERGSVIITSNKGIRDWSEIFAGDEVLATEILNRLLHHCHVVQIDGRSYRFEQIELSLNEGAEKFPVVNEFLRHGQMLRMVEEKMEMGTIHNRASPCAIRYTCSRLSLGRLLSSRADFRFTW